MTKRIYAARGAFIACAAFGLISGANAAPFTNGDFETPDIGNLFNQIYNPGDDIGGWSVVGGNVLVFGAGAGADLAAESGAQWLDPSGTSGVNQGVTQTFDTAIGHTYEVTFGIGAVNGATFVDPTINATPVLGSFQLTNSGTTIVWQDFTFDFMAGFATTALGFFNGDAPGGFNGGIDNVRIADLGAVAATPLPAALPMFASGVGLVGLLARRRKRKAIA